MDNINEKGMERSKEDILAELVDATAEDLSGMNSADAEAMRRTIGRNLKQEIGMLVEWLRAANRNGSLRSFNLVQIANGVDRLEYLLSIATTFGYIVDENERKVDD